MVYLLLQFQVWSLAMAESDEYQSILKSKLDCLVKRDKLVKKVLKGLQEAEEALNGIGAEINTLETDSVAMEMDEVMKKVNDIRSNIKVIN